MMESATPAPKFFIEYNPKRILPSEDASSVAGRTVKSPKLSLTSGASTGMPMRLHSFTISAVFSMSPASAESTAAMYSTGKFAFI